MSARPDVPRLSEEELDLLISRSLDGDLSPEEEQQLERLVALDAAAARRRDELAALVADMKALPAPATPFALATRVNGNVGERAGRPGSLSGRFGFFPAPGFAKAALLVLGIVGVSIAVLRPVPKRLVEGPVDVLLYNPPPAASAPAPQTVLAEANAAPRTREFAQGKALAKEESSAKREAFAQEADERRKDGAANRRSVGGDVAGGVSGAKPSGEKAPGELEDKKAAAKLEGARQNEIASASDAPAVARLAPKQKTDRDEGAAVDATREQAHAKVTSAGALSSGAAAPAAPPPAPAGPGVSGAPAFDEEKRAPRGWTVSVRGDAGRRWSLRRAPDNPPPARGAAVYRVTLDASGGVTALSRVGAAPADPRLDAFVRGMVFERIAPPAELQARTAAKDASGASADFEIGLEPR